MKAEEMVNVCIVDDHASFRDSLAFMLGLEPDIDIVGQAGTVAEARTMLAETNVDVALIDLDLPDGKGLEILPEVLAGTSGSAVIVLTGSVHPESKALAIAAGALGMLHKSSNVKTIVEAIRQVAQGRCLFPASEMSALIRQAAQFQARSQATQSALQLLTAREQDVLRGLAAGFDNQAIADHLALSTTTVRSHVAQVLRKLNVESRLQAALLAVRANLADPNEPDLE